jgi:hypothetical protein
MFVPRIGQRLFLSLALGLILTPSISWASHIIQHPFFSDPTQENNPPYAHPIPSTSDVGSVTIAHTGSPAFPPASGATYFGTLDLKNNDLIIQTNSPANAQAAYLNAVDQVRSGLGANSDWTGTGITSSTVAFDLAHSGDMVSPTPGITAIGVVMNADAGYTTFDGIAVDANSVLVKYTFLGDTDLEGQVTGFDEQIVTNNNDNGVTGGGWISGDFGYQGAVNGFDQQQAVNNQISQSQYPFTSPAAVSSGAVGAGSVPEPSSIVLLGLAALVAVGWRMRKR